MTDMTLNMQQVQTTQNTQQNTTQKPKAAEGESFSEKLEKAVTESNGNAAAAEQNTEEAEQIGAQMAAETLIEIPLNLIVPTVENTEIAVEAAPAVDAAVSQIPVENIIPEQAANVEIAPEAQVPVTEQAAEQPAEVLQQDIPQNLQKVEIIPADKITVEQANVENTADAEVEQPIDKLQAQSQFSKSVQQAQHLIRNTDSATSLRSQPLKIDIDELQKKVDAGEFLAQAQAAKQPAPAEQVEFKPEVPQNVEPREIFSQIREGVDTHVAQNDSDFTIKLRPEGLGEITVKLVSQDGRVTLSLSASDANVQRLLGSEINNLRDIMRPYNVEVAQVEESNSAVFADLQQQLQQQSSQHNAPQQQNGFFANDYVEFPEVEETAVPQQPDAILDQYI